MTVHTLQTALPHIPLKAGMVLQLDAIDPTTGAAVSGVTVTRWAIYGDDDSDYSVVGDDVVPPYTPLENFGEG